MSLHYGDEAEIVLSIQKKLCDLGYYIPKITGIMDNATVRAIIRYQRASGIFPNNGQVGEATLRALKLI